MAIRRKHIDSYYKPSLNKKVVDHDRKIDYVDDSKPKYNKPEKESSKRKKVGLNTYWEGHLSINGNPAGEFTNEQGEIIGYSSYDKIYKLTEKATPWLKSEYNKQEQKSATCGHSERVGDYCEHCETGTGLFYARKIKNWFQVTIKGKLFLVNKYGVVFGGTPENPIFLFDDVVKKQTDMTSLELKDESEKLIKKYTGYKLSHRSPKGRLLEEPEYFKISDLN